MSAELGHAFKVRLWNFKATGINGRGTAPFCLRGNFDGKPFNTEYFHGQAMAPIWALDTRFEYTVSSLETLPSKYLLLECYGADVFLGMARVDLHTLATGPTSVEISLREGQRINGSVSFEAQVEHVTSCSLQLSRMCLGHVAMRGTDAPSPYIAFGLAETGCTVESVVAPGATAPEWERLPPLHKRTTYQELCETRLQFELRHARNGFSPGVSDPVMAQFDLPLGTVPLDVGRDTAVPVRIMVHSAPSYPFAFSTQCTAFLEVRNGPRLVQLRGGLLTDSGIVGGAPPSSGTAMPRSPPRAVSPRRGPPASPPRVGDISHSFAAATGAPMPAAASVAAPLPAAAAMPPMPPQGLAAEASRARDVELLDEVTGHQQELLQKVATRLQEVARRRADVAAQIATLKTQAVEQQEGNARRRGALEAEMAATVDERGRLEEALKGLQQRRVDEERVAAQQGAERERARRALEEEQQEIAGLQQRVGQLRDDMARHLEDEEARYMQRLREAEESKRRAAQDADELAQLEMRVADAETRAVRRQQEGEQRSVRRGRSMHSSMTSPQRR